MKEKGPPKCERAPKNTPSIYIYIYIYIYGAVHEGDYLNIGVFTTCPSPKNTHLVMVRARGRLRAQESFYVLVFFLIRKFSNRFTQIFWSRL